MENKITAILLAGGKSQRMGTDKGSLHLNGKTFIKHICDALQPIVGSNILIVSANKEYDVLGFSRVEDIVENKGPVGGLYTALAASKTKINLVLSIDVPMVSTELLQWLIESHNETDMVTQTKSGDKTSPLIGVYDRSMRIVFGEHMAGNQLKLRQVIEDVKHQTIEVPEKWSNQLQNINTQEEYQNLIK
ncbi:molybdenum cofactor guanylyltransferase [Flavobacterium laiguense]|uniref:Probable molybdenum cofactor guanylyltransferase n=1 Tax=Flavobacterium laiguense TaxID=2169409 RepID=A0A2U1JSE0_9FLAO|nr:molybdenum cofactor guanylyltransferase [Flavobacterium laiguense]PWA07728.1 molybdenum cofactor guanylyltransferase [Flavobacterium laiguense]